MTSDHSLKRFVCWANREWFGGALPEVSIFWEPVAQGVADCVPVDQEEWVIRVDPATSIHDCHWKLDTAHELVHIYLAVNGYDRSRHGKLFDAEIQRLCSFRSYRKLL